MEFLVINKIKGMRFPFKSYLSKLSFELGKNPRNEKRNDWQRFIPEGKKAVLIISADFELAWAFRFTKGVKNPIKYSEEKARQARKNFPQILHLCEQYNIPVTWATVGHLFLDSCQKENGLAHPGIKRIAHFESPYWKFSEGDWFKDDPCSNIDENPEWYAPDLIDRIIKSPVKHEIGCHTFSHLDCRETVCSKEVFELELNECKKLARGKNIELKSFVYPGHTFGNQQYLKPLGFTSYRNNMQNAIGYPYQDEHGTWVHKSTTEFSLRTNWSINYHIYRYKKMVDRAIKNKAVLHFWFHPSFEEEIPALILPVLFKYINQKRADIFITTMGEYTDWLIKNSKDKHNA